MNDRHPYQADRCRALGDEGRRVILPLARQIRDSLDFAGAFQVARVLCPRGVGAVDAWMVLNLLDVLEECDHIRQVTPPNVAGQHRVYVGGSRSWEHLFEGAVMPWPPRGVAR